jgi:hypothetical protein
MRKTLGFSMLLKCLGLDMVILINVTQYGASFLLQRLKNHQTCSYPLLPVLGGYQKQEKKRPQAVFSAILSIHNHSSQKNWKKKRIKECLYNHQFSRENCQFFETL